jgi:hypothetical protein
MHKKKLKNLLIAAAATGMVVSLTVPNLTLSENAWTYTNEDKSASSEEEEDEKDKDSKKKGSEDKDSEEKDSKEKDSEDKDSKEEDSKDKDSKGTDSGEKDSEDKNSEEKETDQTESAQKESGEKDSGEQDEKTSDSGDDAASDSDAKEKDAESGEEQASDGSEQTEKETVKPETGRETSEKTQKAPTEQEISEEEKSDALNAVIDKAQKNISKAEKSVDSTASKEKKKETVSEKNTAAAFEGGLEGTQAKEEKESAVAGEFGSGVSGAITIPTGEIVPSPVIYHPFRFWTVAKDAMYAADDLRIYEEKSTSSRVIGTLQKNGVCYFLKDEKKDWYYVESGQARGFVRKSELITGEDAQDMTEKLDGKKEVLAKVLVPVLENEAFAHYRATVHQTVVEKDPALAAVD